MTARQAKIATMHTYYIEVCFAAKDRMKWIVNLQWYGRANLINAGYWAGWSRCSLMKVKTGVSNICTSLSICTNVSMLIRTSRNTPIDSLACSYACRQVACESHIWHLPHHSQTKQVSIHQVELLTAESRCRAGLNTYPEIMFSAR